MRDRARVLPRCLLAAVVLLGLPGCVSAPRSTAQFADELPAFLQVDEGLYRGGQPSPAGLRHLRQLGVQTVISLRHGSRATKEERWLVEQLGMRWVNIPMWYGWPPSQRQVDAFLAIATDNASRPVFVHCRRGRNRAGIMVAIYRVVHQHWTPQRAYAEGRRLGLASWNFLTRHSIFHQSRRTLAGPMPLRS